MAGYLPFDESNLMTLYKKVQRKSGSSLSLFLLWILFWWAPLKINLRSHLLQIGGVLILACRCLRSVFCGEVQIHKADFTCPPWFSTAARRFILQILDPNPKTVCMLNAVLMLYLFQQHCYIQMWARTHRIVLFALDMCKN
jgi:hypothetical protein